jgi:hypothetical protein
MSNKIKLVESISVTSNDYKKVNSLNEENSTIYIQEKSGEKVEYKAIAVYTFPISKPNQENFNGRIYSSKLWENVIKKKFGENTYGLMDHPKDEGSTKDRWCVWRNVRFTEDKKTILADAYLFGRWGKEVNEGLEAGGNVGLSTSGYGEFQEDKKTVDPESYELERVADFVFNPSYDVFGTLKDKKESTEEPKELEKKETIKEKIQMEENVKKVSSFEEKSFKLNILSSFKEAKKLQTIKERMSSFSELLSYFEEGVAEELKKEIEEALEQEKKSFEELAEKGEKVEEFVEDGKKDLKEKVVSLEEEITTLKNEVTTLEEKLAVGEDLLDSMKVYTKKIKEMMDVAIAEKNGMVTPTEYKEALIFIEQLEEEKTSLEKEIITLRKKVEKPVVEKKKVEKEEEEEEDDEEVEEKKKEKKESFEGIPKEIVSYYTDLEYRNPSIYKIKEDILKCGTLMEAQRTYLRLKSLLNTDYDTITKKVERKNNTFVEDTRSKLSIREGWL